MNPNKLGQLICKICQGITEKPDSVKVDCSHTEHMACYVIKASDGDISRLLGKGGRNIKAIAYIAGQIAKHAGYSIKINIDSKRVEGQHGKFSRFENNPNYDSRAEVALLQEICDFAVKHEKIYSIDVDKFTTALVVSGAEQNDILLDNLTSVFGAIGKNKGRIVYVEMK